MVLVGIALSVFVPDIVYRSDITEYFEPDNAQVKEFRALEASLGMQQSLLVLVKLNQAQFISSESINSLFQMSKALREIPGVERTHSILSTAISTDQQDTRSLYRHLATDSAITDSVLGQLADNAYSNPALISQDGQVAALSVFFESEEAIAKAYADIQATLKKFFQAPRAQTLMLGPVEIKHALHQALLHDGFYLMPLVLICGLGTLWYFLRSFWLVLAGGVSVILSLWICAGLVGLFKFSINQTSSLAFCVTFIIALADIIHLLTSYKLHAVKLPPSQAMINALRFNGLSLFLTSLTTGIGFLSLNGSESPVFATFGNIAAIGVACAFICAVTVTPVVALLKSQTANPSEPPYFAQWIATIARFRSRLRGRHFLLFYGASVALSCAALLNHFHNDPLDYFESDSPITLATRLSEQSFQVHHPVSIRLDSHKVDGIFAEDFLATVYHFQVWLDNHPWVAQSSSFTDTLLQLSRHLHNNNLKWAQSPTNGPAAADLWNVYQMASPDNNPQSLGLDDSFRTATLTVGTIRLSSSELIEFREQVNAWFAQNNANLEVAVTGHAMMFASIGKQLTHNMLIGALVTAIVISCLIGIFLGHWKLGIISLIPNLFPAGIVYGVWGGTVGIIDIAAAGTLSISLGIVVDDTIHILKHYMEHRKTGKSPEQSIQETLAQVGPALLLTTMVLTLGMLLLTFSIFGPNQTTAIFMASIITVALAYDLIMLPHLLKLFDRWLFPSL